MKTVRYTACGGVVVAGDRVLVLLRPSRSELRLPKGKLELGEELEQAARREIAEESGFSALELVEDLGEQTIEFERLDEDGSPMHVTRDERFFLYKLTDKERGEQHPDDVEEFVPDFRPFEQALADLTYEAEKEWVRRAQAALAGAQSANS